MKRYAAAATVAATITAVTVFAPIDAVTPFGAARAAEAGSVIETVQLRYLKPSVAVRSLKEGLNSTRPVPGPPFPQGLADLSPNDGDSTLIIAGTTSAVEEIKSLLRLLDVRPRRVQVKTRLFEVRFPRVGITRETLISSSTFTGKNNETVSMSVRSPSEPGMNIEVTPHINGDNSFSLAATLRVRRFISDAPVRRIEISGIDTVFRIPRQGEWTSSATVAIGHLKPVPGTDSDGDKPVPAPYPEDPRYRLEASVIELPEAPAKGGK